MPSKSVQCFSTSVRLPLSVWHYQLGHPCRANLTKTLIRCNIPFTDSNKFVDCVACHLGKECKLPFSKSTTVYTLPLQLVVADVWGPALVASNDFRYYVAFTDAYSRYTWLYFLKNKSDVLTVFS